MNTTFRLTLLLLLVTSVAPALAGGGARTVSCGIVCGSYNVPCGGHLEPTCSSGGACDGNNVAFNLPAQHHYTYNCPGFPCSGASYTFTVGCYNPLDPPTCNECSANGQYQCVPSTGCGGLCDPGLTPDANGFCVSCGGSAELQCNDGDPTCDAGYFPAGTHCYADGCGDSGEAACGSNPNGECYAWNNYIPVAHQCVACGDEFEVTCGSGASCMSGLEIEFDGILGYDLCSDCGGDQERVCLSGAPCREPGIDEIGPSPYGFDACGACGGSTPDEPACWGATPCDPGLTHATDAPLAGDIGDCLPALSSDALHYVKQNGICSVGAPAPMVRTAPESWPAVEDASPGRNTVFLLHGRGARCGGGMDNVLDAGGLYDAGHLTYCVEYAQENDPGIDPRAVRILPVSDDVLGIPQPTCTMTNCGFDENNLVAEILAPAPAGQVPSVAEVGIALRDAILQVPVEGDVTMIAHSQGGFIARELIYSHYDELRWSGKKIARVITLQHPYFGKHPDPHLYTPWTCNREANFDCSTGAWLWGWDLNAPATVSDSDYPQIEWTAGSGAGVLGNFTEDPDGDGTPSTSQDWACLYNFGGVWSDDVLYDASVPIEGSLGYDEFGYFAPAAADLPFDRKYHGTGTHNAANMLWEMIDTPASCTPGTGLGSPPDTCQGVDASAGVLPYTTDPPRPPDVLEFNGSTTRVTIDDPAATAALEMSTSLTIDTWVYPMGTGTSGAGGLFVNKEGEYWFGRWGDGNLVWALADGSWVARVSSHYLPEYEWTHVALTYDGTAGTARLYANGTRVQTWTGLGAGIGDVNTGEDRLDIGARAVGNQFFDGRLDDVRVWSTAFSDAEIYTLMHGQPTGIGAMPVVWYRFDEDGDTMFDQSGNAFHGSISTLGPASTPIRQRVRRLDKPGGALYFDGDDDRALLEEPAVLAGLDMASTMTIEGWMYLRSYDFATMMVNNDGRYWLSASNGGQVGFAVANSSPGWVGVYSDYYIPLKTWTHVALVYDTAVSGIAKLYVNGQFEEQWNVSGPIGDVSPGANWFSIGSQKVDHFVHGLIDEVRIWNVARNATEIEQNYNRTLAAPQAESGLAGYWSFDERYGSVAFDRSGNGAHLILQDGTSTPYRSMAPHLPGYPVIYEGACGNGFIEPMEDCDLGDGVGGDGCSATCRLESIFEVMGDAQGGSVSIDVAGMTIIVTTTAGQTSDQVAAAIAAAIQADATLASLGIGATSSGDQVFIGGDYSNPVITDPGLMDCATALPFPVIDGNVMNVCPETGVLLSTSGPYSEYQWFYEGQPLGGANGVSTTATVTGDYSVRVGDGSGCQRESFPTLTFVTFCPETEVSPAGAVFPLELAKQAASPTGYYATFQNVDDVDGFHLYEGTLGAWYDHGSTAACQLQACGVPNDVGCVDDLGNGQARTALSPSSGNRYYLVSAYQGSDEGPAGTDSNGTPRDPAQSTCLP